MRPDRLDRILRDLTARPTRDAAPGRRELETELLARHERTMSRERGFLMTTILKRPVFAVLLLAVLGVGACTVPTETELEVGQRLTYTLTDKAVMSQVGDLVQFVIAQPGVDDVHIEEEATDDGPLVIDLVVWGRGFKIDTLVSRIGEAFPAMAKGHLETEVLSTDVKTSIAEKLGHDFLHLDLHVEGTNAEIRAQILEQIYESGFEGTADVDVHTEDGVTTVDLEMTHEGVSGETEDVIKIEMINEDE
jgi:hypothetical protein